MQSRRARNDWCIGGGCTVGCNIHKAPMAGKRRTCIHYTCGALRLPGPILPRTTGRWRRCQSRVAWMPRPNAPTIVGAWIGACAFFARFEVNCFAGAYSGARCSSSGICCTVGLGLVIMAVPTPSAGIWLHCRPTQATTSCVWNHRDAQATVDGVASLCT